MAIDRQGVGPVRRVEQARRSTRTVDTAVDNGMPTYEPSAGLRIADSLINLTKQGGEIYASQLKKKIELDKVQQTYRAYQGADVSDGATVAGKRSHDVVTSRDAVLTANDTIVENLRTAPDMSDEDYNRMSQEVYAPLLNKYDQDPEMMAFLSAEMQKSQKDLHKARSDIRRDYQKVQNEDAFRGSLNSYLSKAANPAELQLAIEGSLRTEGMALGVSDSTQRNMLINQAQQAANNGDSRLLQALQGIEWAQGDTRLNTAKTNFESWEAQEYATSIGSEMANLQDAWENGRANWAQVEAKMAAINDRFPGTFSASRIASIKKSGLDKQRENYEIAAAVAGSWKPLTDQNATKLGYQGLGDKEINQVIAGVTKQIGEVGNKLVSEGKLSAEELPSWRMQQQVQWSKANQVAIPQLKGVMNSVMFTDPEQFNVNDGLPSNVMMTMAAFDQMDPGTLSMYGGEKLSSYWLNYQKFKQSEGDTSAMYRAWKQTINPVQLSQKERGELNDSISDTVKAKSAGFWSRQLSNLTGGDAVAIPEWEQSRVSREINASAQDLVSSGAYDVEGVSDFASRQFTERNTMLPNGTYITGNADQLAPILGVKKGEVGESFDHYLHSNLKALQAESGIDNLGAGDVRFQYRPQSHSVVIIDKLGNTISAPLRLEDIGEGYREASASGKIQSALRSRESAQQLDERLDNYTTHSQQLIR